MNHLKLKACDGEDLGVLSACWQDAIVPVSELVWQPETGCFGLVGQRFRWEELPAGSTPPGTTYHRILSRLWLKDVKDVKLKDIDLTKRDQMLELLAIREGREPDGRASLDLLFCGGGAVKVIADQLTCYSEDMGEPWPTPACPCHTI